MNMSFINKKIFDDQIVFDVSGCVYLHSLKILVISDLHYGKSLSFFEEGNMIPPYDLDETIKNLNQVVLKYNPLKLVFLGDNFHDNHTLKNLSPVYLDKLNSLINNIETIWIEGNHDYNLKNKKKIKGNFQNYYYVKNYEFVHIKSEVNEFNNLQFSGHYHPKTTFKINGVNFQFKCFVLTKNFCILPSFGTYTGGLDINSKKFSQMLPLKKKIIVLGNKQIIEISK